MLEMRRSKRTRSGDEALLALNEERAKRARALAEQEDVCMSPATSTRQNSAVNRNAVAHVEFSSTANPLFSQLPTEVVEHISLYLEPRDRLRLAMSCREMKSVVWNEDLVWDQLAHSVQNNKFGVSTRDVFLYEQRRRNRQFVSMRRVILKTFYQLCVGCEIKRTGEEKITGLGLCAECLGNHPTLGVCPRTKAKRDYFLCDKDLEELGERSAVLEYDCNRLMVHRVHFYRRALRKKALEKYGGTAGFRREVVRRAKNLERRRKLILQRREKRSQELEAALGKVKLSLSDVLLPCLPRMEVSLDGPAVSPENSASLVKSPFFLEDFVMFTLERFLNQPRSNQEDVALLVHLVQAKILFRENPEIRSRFLSALCSGLEGYANNTQMFTVAMLKLSALKSSSVEDMIERTCDRNARDSRRRKRPTSSRTAN